MVHVLRDAFEIFLAILHWSQSSTTLLMIVPILTLCPHVCFIDLLCDHLDGASVGDFLTIHVSVISRNHRAFRVQLLHLLLTLPRMYSYFWMWQMSNSTVKWTFLFVVLCAFS